jgi:hypothetical protein
MPPPPPFLPPTDSAHAPHFCQLMKAERIRLFDIMQTTAAPVIFYSNPICPFAHRVWLSLLETLTPHEFQLVSLDPSGKGREWYTPIYRAALGADQDPDSFGAVPVIRDGDFLLAESAPIARYVFAKSAIKPTPEEDARISIFMEQVGGNIIGPWCVLFRALCYGFSVAIHAYAAGTARSRRRLQLSKKNAKPIFSTPLKQSPLPMSPAAALSFLARNHPTPTFTGSPGRSGWASLHTTAISLCLKLQSLLVCQVAATPTALPHRFYVLP